MEQNYIGENIRIYRERANLTQQQLADKVGITWEMISRYERNESLPFRKLDGISKALDVPKSQLVERHTP
ncbi:MAG TPA: helix-turn-helix transcriptional regulator, partial [Candidatus Dojkabacteria bacterium]|nr:helix-turn-helix transcriptional regulator [Candidatus Dojkabacteria bacterium]